MALEVLYKRLIPQESLPDQNTAFANSHDINLGDNSNVAIQDHFGRLEPQDITWLNSIPSILYNASDFGWARKLVMRSRVGNKRNDSDQRSGAGGFLETVL